MSGCIKEINSVGYEAAIGSFFLHNFLDAHPFHLIVMDQVLCNHHLFVYFGLKGTDFMTGKISRKLKK
ncbi:unknown [Parabacteroides sp. CAG:409]|nr:unknown [Parabacteroides sp. CAG:409]